MSDHPRPDIQLYRIDRAGRVSRIDPQERRPLAERLMIFAKWKAAHEAECRVALDQIGDLTVSTVFLGIAHDAGAGHTTLYETMIFRGAQMVTLYGRWGNRASAERMHAQAVRSVQASE